MMDDDYEFGEEPLEGWDLDDLLDEDEKDAIELWGSATQQRRKSSSVSRIETDEYNGFQDDDIEDEFDSDDLDDAEWGFDVDEFIKEELSCQIQQQHHHHHQQQQHQQQQHQQQQQQQQEEQQKQMIDMQQQRLKKLQHNQQDQSSFDFSNEDMTSQPSPKELVLPDVTRQEIDELCQIHFDIAQVLLDSLYPSKRARFVAEQRELQEDLKQARSMTVEQNGGFDIPGIRWSASQHNGAQRPKRRTSEVRREAQRTLVHEGWMEKRGGGTSRMGNTRFKKRWMELTFDRIMQVHILTYAVELGEGVKGEIKLDAEATVKDRGDAKGHLLSISIEKPFPRTYVFRLASKSEKLNWLRVLQAICPQSGSFTLGKFSSVLRGNWLHIGRAKTKGTKLKNLWVELHEKDIKTGRATLVVYRNPDERKAAASIPLLSTSLVKEHEERTTRFEIRSGPQEYIVDCRTRDLQELWVNDILELAPPSVFLRRESTVRNSSSSSTTVQRSPTKRTESETAC